MSFISFIIAFYVMLHLMLQVHSKAKDREINNNKKTHTYMTKKGSIKRRVQPEFVFYKYDNTCEGTKQVMREFSSASYRSDGYDSRYPH